MRSTYVRFLCLSLRRSLAAKCGGGLFLRLPKGRGKRVCRCVCISIILLYVRCVGNGVGGGRGPVDVVVGGPRGLVEGACGWPLWICGGACEWPLWICGGACGWPLWICRWTQPPHKGWFPGGVFDILLGGWSAQRRLQFGSLLKRILSGWTKNGGAGKMC